MSLESINLHDLIDKAEALYRDTGTDAGMEELEAYSKGAISLSTLASRLLVLEARTPKHELLISSVSGGLDQVKEHHVYRLLILSPYPKSMAEYLMNKRPDLMIEVSDILTDVVAA